MPCGSPWKLQAYSLPPAGSHKGKEVSPSQGFSLTRFVSQSLWPGRRNTLIGQTTAMYGVSYEGLELWEKGLA